MFTVCSNNRSHIEYKQASSFLPFTYYHLSKEDYKGLSQLWLMGPEKEFTPTSNPHSLYRHMLQLGKGSFLGSCHTIAQGMTHGFTTSPHLLSSANSLTSLPPFLPALLWLLLPPSSPARTDGIIHHYSMAWMSPGPPIWPKLGQKQVHILLTFSVHHSKDLMWKTVSLGYLCLTVSSVCAFFNVEELGWTSPRTCMLQTHKDIALV